MESGQINWITSFIWRIADDVLRDLYVRGKYRDVILPMVVLRRLDAVLEPTKQDVLATRAMLDNAGITNHDAALRQAAGQAFYNTSKFTLRDLRARSSQQQLCGAILSPTLTAFRRMSKRFSITSSSVIRSRAYRKRMRSAR